MNRTSKLRASAAPTCGGKAGQVCTVTDGRSAATSLTYNSLGELTREAPPAPLGARTYTYYTAGRIPTVTDGRGQVTRYSHDNLDRVLQTRFSGVSTCDAAAVAAGSCLSSTYDGDGNPLTLTDEIGSVTDGHNRLGGEVTRTVPGGAFSAGTSSLTYGSQGTATPLPAAEIYAVASLVTIGFGFLTVVSGAVCGAIVTGACYAAAR